MRPLLALFLVVAWVACGKASEPGSSAEPRAAENPVVRARELAAPCLARTPKSKTVQVKAALASDGKPTAVIVTGTRDAMVRACVARAIKSVAFPQAGERLDLDLRYVANDGE